MRTVRPGMQTDNGLYCIEPLIEIVETVFCTGLLPQSNPISIVLVGPSGTAKSKLLKVYNNAFIHHTDSISSAGLHSICRHDPSNEIKFIVLPDFNPTLSRNPRTATALIANLLSLTADGMVRVDDGRSGEEKSVKHNPVGIITACTPEIFDKNAKQWQILGIRRRILPICYTYSAKTEVTLMRLVREGKIQNTMLTPKAMKIYKLKQNPAPSSSQLDVLEKLADKMSINLGKRSFISDGVRNFKVVPVVAIAPFVVLKILCAAHALRDNRTETNDDDVRFCSEFVEFTDIEDKRKI